MDRRVHFGLLVNLPTDVDLKTGIRRIWPIHRPQKMFLNDTLIIYLNDFDNLSFDVRYCFYHKSTCSALSANPACEKQEIWFFLSAIDRPVARMGPRGKGPLEVPKFNSVPP